MASVIFYYQGNSFQGTYRMAQRGLLATAAHAVIFPGIGILLFQRGKRMDGQKSELRMPSTRACAKDKVACVRSQVGAVG
ncbi:hypothetical protein ACLOJK_010918 [Asimina triloba]